MLKIVLVLLLSSLGLALAGLAPTDSEPIYSVYVPQEVRPGFELAVTVSMLKSIRPVRFDLSFTSSDMVISFSTSMVIGSGVSRKIPLGTIPRSFHGSKIFNLTLEGSNPTTGEVLFTNHTSNFHFISKSQSILIETDKTIYRPGHTIKYRALCLTPELRPLTGVISYRIQDPNDNIVFQNSSELVQGVAGNEFVLSRYATEGDWTILFTYKGLSEKVNVVVKHYKLPKFEVKLLAPTVLYPQMEGITITLKADYTFGQPLSGKAWLRFEMKSTYGSPSFPPKTFTKTLTRFNGKQVIFIPMSEIAGKLKWMKRTDMVLHVTGYVTEALTSTTRNATTEIDMKLTKVKVDVVSKPTGVKPGLLYQALVRVTEQDGALLMEPDMMRNDLIVEAQYNYPQYDRELYRPIIYTFEIQPDGLVHVEIPIREDNFTSILYRVFTNTTKSTRRYSNSWTANRAQSPSNSYIQITPSGASARGGVTVGSIAEVLIRSNKMVRNLHIMVLSNGRMVQDWIVEEVPSWPYFYSFPTTLNMTPSVTVLASYLTEEDEIVVDSHKIDVTLALPNTMSIRLSDVSVDAGTNVSIRVDTSSAGGFVGIRGVDQSVLLLKSGNDITKERVVADLENYDSDFPSVGSFYNYRFDSGFIDAEKIFRDSRVTVLTNALVYGHKPIRDSCIQNYGRAESARFSSERGLTDDINFSAPSPVAAKALPKPSRVRNLFPETWLWSSALTKSDGSVWFNATVPDTITSWEISSFSMSHDQGLGIAEKEKLTVYRNFFVSLNLPLKITRGEIIIVQAIVFNYHNQDLDTTIHLHMNDNLYVELLRPQFEPTPNGPIRRHIIPAGGAITVKFPLRISALGEVPIQVTASTTMGMLDSVIRRVFVKPEGIDQCYSTSALFSSVMNGINDKTLQIQIPEGAVSGSAKVNLHTYGDILGSTMTNLGKLLKTPSGCGEQNMINFAPDVFITLYLQRVNKLDHSMKMKAYQHIIEGYTNQLRYRHRDGSFSAFGESDSSGSTWLTAFVTKCFIHARQLDEKLVDKTVIDDAIDYMIRQQKRDGSFMESGRVINQAMQGGLNSPITMTAYVLISLLEAPYARSDRRLRRPIHNARLFLERVETRDAIIRDPYALSMVTYALYLAGSERSETLLEEMDALAISRDGYQYWEDLTSGSSTYNPRWSRPYYPASSNEIEITSYALLQFNRRNNVDRIVPILRWVVSKQNTLGGYTSTQDTVIAVQALSMVASKLASDGQDLFLTVTHSEEDSFRYNVSISEITSVVYNTVELPSVDGSVTISAEGVGVGVAQLSVCYNIPTTPYDQEPFHCNVNVTNSTYDWAKVDFCCSLADTAMEPTGMFLFEIGLLNGFTVDVLDEERRNPSSRLVEVDEDSVNLYFDQLLPQQRLCSSVKLLRYLEVASVKAVPVKAFEYYKPEKKVVRLYNVDSISETGACQVCGYECLGCPAPVLSEWKEWSECVEFCKPENSTRVQNCFDPSVNKTIDIFRCGYDTLPMETRLCNKSFTCPASSDGLWKDLPRSYRFYGNRKCFVVGGSNRSPWTVIPGTTLNGNDQFIRCSINPLNVRPRSPRLMKWDPMMGFTLSFLVRPSFYKSGKPTTFLSVGEIGELPIISFEKPIQKDELRFVVSIDKKRDFVENISLSWIPAGNWSHVVLKWNKATGGQVYVNGEEVGTPFSTRVANARKITKSVQFILGRKPIGDKQKQGFFPGSYSALHFWQSPLMLNEVRGLSDYYKEILHYSTVEPLLPVRHLRELAPENLEKCFKQPTYLSFIYAEDAKCDF